jgi:phosphoglycolate phosphatase
MKTHYEAYLFDLDGTLVDSAPDIGAALNYSLQQASLPVVSLDLVRHWIGHGSRTLVRQALLHRQMQPENRLIDQLLGPFLSYYVEHIADHSQLYPNTMATLLELKQRGARLAIVTNKLTELSLPLLTALDLKAHFDLIVCGDTTAKPKPAPDPIQHVLDLFKVGPEQALMIGDSDADIGAARAARVDVVCLRDGYNHGVDVASLNPDKVVDSIKELL